MIVSVQPKRLPSHVPPDDTIPVLGTSSRVLEPSLYFPQNLYTPDWNSVDIRPLSEPRSTQEIASDERTRSNGSADKDEEQDISDSVDKRNNHSPRPPTHHHWDICYVSYDIRDLGHHFYPRYIETANCNNHLPEKLQQHIKCAAIHYHVQVLTQRKDSDPVEDNQRSTLPDSLKEWRFVSIPVNVGCHCVPIV